MAVTVQELINQLTLLPADSIVLVDGYEGGYADIVNPRVFKVKLHVHTEDYYGPHEEDPHADLKAVLIRRMPNHLSEA